MAGSSITVQAYRKSDLRRLLLNPGLDIYDTKAMALALPLHHKKWLPLLHSLKGQLPEAEWKTCHILSERAVRLILKKV